MSSLGLDTQAREERQEHGNTSRSADHEYILYQASKIY